MDSWGSIPFDALVDGSTGAYPMPTYQSYGSVRHVPNSAIDIIQYTGTGLGEVTYTVIIASSDYTTLLAAYKAIPRIYDTLTVTSDLGTWYIDSIADAVAMIDGRVMCSITFREIT